MILKLAYNPVGAFQTLKEADCVRLAVILLVVRWTVSPLTTVLAMYLHDSPMALDPPFGFDRRTYRFYEIFWYGPYGIVMMLAIAQMLCLNARQLSRNPGISFRRTFTIVCLCFFTPWLVTVPGDYLLVHSRVNAAPAFLVPFHLTILAWECVLVAIAVRVVFGLAKWRCAALGLTAAALFVGLGGLVIR